MYKICLLVCIEHPISPDISRADTELDSNVLQRSVTFFLLVKQQGESKPQNMVIPTIQSTEEIAQVSDHDVTEY